MTDPTKLVHILRSATHFPSPRRCCCWEREKFRFWDNGRNSFLYRNRVRSWCGEVIARRRPWWLRKRRRGRASPRARGGRGPIMVRRRGAHALQRKEQTLQLSGSSTPLTPRLALSYPPSAILLPSSRSWYGLVLPIRPSFQRIFFLPGSYYPSWVPPWFTS